MLGIEAGNTSELVIVIGFYENKNNKDIFLTEIIEIGTLEARSQIKPLLHSRYYVEVSNKWRGPTPRLSA